MLLRRRDVGGIDIVLADNYVKSEQDLSSGVGRRLAQAMRPPWLAGIMTVNR